MKQKLILDENFDNVQVDVQAVASPTFVDANREHDRNKEKFEKAKEANKEAVKEVTAEDKEVKPVKTKVLKQMHLSESLFDEDVSARPNHDKLLDLLYGGVIDYHFLAKNLMRWLPDDELGEFLNFYGLDTDNFDESMQDHNRLHDVKMMHEVMLSMNDEDAYMTWIYTMPDQPDEVDFENFAEDKEDFNDLKQTFNRLFKRYKKSGLYKPSEEAKAWLKKNGYEIEISESLVEAVNDEKAIIEKEINRWFRLYSKSGSQKFIDCGFAAIDMAKALGFKVMEKDDKYIVEGLTESLNESVEDDSTVRFMKYVKRFQEHYKLANPAMAELLINTGKTLKAVDTSVISESLEEIDRKVFRSLNKETEEPGIYYVLNDGNFERKIYADSDEKAIEQFRAKAVKEEIQVADDGWEVSSDLTDVLDDIQSLSYEINNCVRGAYSGCDTPEELSEYIRDLADRLSDAAYLNESLKEAKLNSMNANYKGYKIRLDRKSESYVIYDKHNELEDTGFKTIDAAKRAIDKLNSHINESIEYSIAKEQLQRFNEGKMPKNWNPNKFIENLVKKKHITKKEAKQLKESFNER